MNPNIQKFLEFFIDLIDEENWEELATQLGKSYYLDEKERSELNQLLSEIGINLIDHLNYIPAGWFSNNESLISYNIPSHIQVIAIKAFINDINLINITFPDQLNQIGYGAFLNCRNLNSIDLSNTNLNDLGSSIFYTCTNLKSIKLPGNLTHMGTQTFKWCTSLNNIVLPKHLRVLDRSTFEGCRGLTNISFEGTIEEWKAVRRYDKCFVGVPARDIQCVDGVTNLRPKIGGQG